MCSVYLIEHLSSSYHIGLVKGILFWIPFFFFGSLSFFPLRFYENHPMIDLRSDTVTKPTAEMLEVMMSAEVGDDVFGADPTVNRLQEKVADLFGKEAALYCPSGTMTNQIAIRVNTEPQDELVCDKLSHIYIYEGGGIMYNSMVSPKLLSGNRGRINLDLLQGTINPDDVHFPRTRLVSVENTMNKGGGSIYKMEDLRDIADFCKKNDLTFHLDGARIFNAFVEENYDLKELGGLFDTISVCFSKGLGAPVGSALIGDEAKIKKARRVRKVMGGAMRQAGYMAAACIYALDHHVDRLKKDHERARSLGVEAKALTYVKDVYPVDSNIVIVELVEGLSETKFLKLLSEQGVEAVGFGKGLVRFVTHLDFDDSQLDEAIGILKNINLKP